jgi:hypothetical protein
LQEMEQETQSTRKMRSCIPDDKFSWKPHEKSMSVKQPATHIAELPTWASVTLTTSEPDFAAQPYEPTDVNISTELLELFEKSLTGKHNEIMR